MLYLQEIQFKSVQDDFLYILSESTDYPIITSNVVGHVVLYGLHNSATCSRGNKFSTHSIYTEHLIE